MNTTNPCYCSGTTVTAPSGPCKPGECICFCDIYISPNSDDAVSCGETGTISLNSQESDTTVCGDTAVTYSLMFFDETFFDGVDVVTTGAPTNAVDLSWTPKAGSTKFSGNAVFKVTCGTLSKLVTVTIGRKDACSGVVCPDGQICEECTGNCIEDNTVFGNIVVEINE